jgi:hypothetical protein
MTGPLDHRRSQVAELLDRARGPMGPEVDVDLGDQRLAFAELGRLISALNGFFTFDAGIQVFRVGEQGWGPELGEWNLPETWKYTYGGLAGDLFCFGQDLLGAQFALDADAAVVRMDAETGRRVRLGNSLEDWAGWLLEDPARGCGELAFAWQRANRPLEPAERLLPRRLLVTGGTLELDNLVAVDAAKAMRIRGPVAQQVHPLPPGTTVRLDVG